MYKNLDNGAVVVACAGAGGTGKSYTVEKVIELINKDYMTRPKGHIYKAVFMPSVVRDFYAENGLKDQAAFFALSVSERRPFQLKLLDYYYDKALEFFEKHPQHIIISDRSPFDHLAYTVNGIQDLTLTEFREIRYKAEAFCKNYIMKLFYFPYPAPFSQDIDPDPFRVAHPSQNLTIDGLIHSFSRDYAKVVKFGTRDERAEYMYQDILDELKVPY